MATLSEAHIQMDREYAILILLTIAGFILFHYAAFGCYTFIDDRYYWYEDSVGYFLVKSRDYGYGAFDCRSLTAYEVSALWKFGRAIAILGALLAWAIGIVLVCGTRYRYFVAQRFLPFRQFLVAAMGCAAGMSALLLVGLADAATLRLSKGGKAAIGATVIWIWAAVMALYRLQKWNARLPLLPPAGNTTTGENFELMEEGEENHKQENCVSSPVSLVSEKVSNANTHTNVEVKPLHNEEEHA